MKQLKTTALILFLGFSAYHLNAQTIITANNNPGALGGVNVYTGPTALVDAITAAVNDDIIHVIRSATDYGSVTITERLNIFGVGLNPSNDGGTRSIVSVINITDPTASGTRISGLHITDRLNLGGVAGALNNLLIENSKIRWIQHTTASTTLSNLIIRNNVISSGFSSGDEHIDLLLGAIANVVIANNVIYNNPQGGQGGINASNGTLFENNLFVGPGVGQSDAWESFTDNVVKNNIFYGQSPQAQISVTGTTFQNNLSYNTPNDVFPSTGGNLSINNIEATNRLLVFVPFAAFIDFSTFDPNLQMGSLAIGGGEDGTDIGVTGGAVPYGEEGTLIPLIQTLSVPTMVVEGEDLNIRIKAKGN